MATKKEATTEQTQEQQVQEAQVQAQAPQAPQPAVTLLTAKTPEELAKAAEDFAKDNAGKQLIYGAAGRSKDTGEYSLRIDTL